jgi:micrococcal nuclease
MLVPDFMNNFWENNQIFLAIIIGAVIISAGVYFGLKKADVVVAPNLSPTNSAPVVEPIQKNSNEAVDIVKCGADNNTIVTKVIDGDTVVVEGGYHIRLLGMDADEKGYPCYEQAKTRLEGLILSKQVILEKDKTNLDQYGRCLRYIFVNSTNVDVQLVKEGLAVARFYEPDVKYRDEISTAEKQAQQNSTGCKWSK